MRRLLMTMVILGGLFGLASLTPTRGSVMAGIQHVVTPVVHAQYPGPVYWNCNELWDNFYLYELDGYQVSIQGEIDLGPAAYGVDVIELYGWMASPSGAAAPFYIYCYQSWY